MNRPGDYSKPDTRAALKELDEVEKTAAPAPEEAEPDLTPAERWRKALQRVKMTEDEAGAVLDAILKDGYWQKTFALFGGRVKLTLRTRDAFNIQRVATAIDGLRNPTQDQVANVTFRVNLASSLYQYNGKTLPWPGADAPDDELDAAFRDRLDFVNRLPSPVVPAVYQTLANFDAMVAAALSEGAASGF